MLANITSKNIWNRRRSIWTALVVLLWNWVNVVSLLRYLQLHLEELQEFDCNDQFKIFEISNTIQWFEADKGGVIHKRTLVLFETLWYYIFLDHAVILLPDLTLVFSLESEKLEYYLEYKSQAIHWILICVQHLCCCLGGLPKPYPTKLIQDMSSYWVVYVWYPGIHLSSFRSCYLWRSSIT